MAVLHIRDGWTERIKYQLSHDGGTIMDLTGMTVTLVGEDRASTAITWAGTVGIDTAATGIAYLDPAATDLDAARSPYRVRWAVTDSGGKTAYFPRDAPLIWNIDIP